MATLGKYELLNPLASGGMAELFLARQAGVRGFERQVVIKRLHPRFATDEAVVRMFIDEASIAARLSHANIVQIYDLGEDQGSYFIAMEYVNGRSLSEIQEKEIALGRPLPYTVVAHVISRVCRGLYHAHTLNDEQGRPLAIVHRDVSPQNVLVSFDGEVKLADFGIAKAASRAAETQAGVLKGKVAYMSPEQVESKPVDARSDVFAVGILLYELTCRRRLFRRNSDFATMRAVVKDPIPPPSAVAEDVPDELEAVILRALARDPDQRYQDAQQMQLELEQAIRAVGQPVTAEDLSGLMEVLFRDELQRIQAGEAIIPASADEETMAEVISRPRPPSTETRPATPARAFIEAPTVVAPTNPQPSLAVPPQATAPDVAAEDRPTAPAGPRLQPEAAFLAALNATTDPGVEPDGGATQIRRPDFDDIIEDQDLLQEVDEDEDETAPGPPAQPVSPRVPGPAPAPPAAARPVPARAATASEPAAPAPTPAARPTASIRPMPTVAAVPAPPPKPRVPRVIVVAVVALMLGSALAALGVYLWKGGVLGPRREGVVQVSSTPPGAMVYLDGEKRFGVTPIPLYGVALEKPHLLVLVLDGHEPWRKRFTLTREQTEVRYAAQLKRSRPGGAPAALEVEVNEPGAEVYLDGVKQGTAPLTLEKVQSGVDHTLVVKKEGFDEATMTVQAPRPGERRKVQVTLVPSQAKLIKGVEKPRGGGLAPGPVVLPPRATVPPLQDHNLGERLPGK